MNTLIISVVSHGQGEILRNLLLDFVEISFFPCILLEVIVTINIPESADYYDNIDLPFRFIYNDDPQGFGANHNAALRGCNCDYVLIINPDIRLDSNLNFNFLIEYLVKNPGVSGPKVISPDGAVQDSARMFPGFFTIFSRTFNRFFIIPFFGNKFNFNLHFHNFDWVAGMFMVFDLRAFNAVGGFDEAYFMYIEDADICRRISDSGFCVSYVNNSCVQHDARRATWTSFKHFKWHLISLIRFNFRSFYRLIKSFFKFF